MKISTILMGAAIVACGLSASAAEENLMRSATEGPTGQIGSGLEAAAVADGWEYWACPFSYDVTMEECTYEEAYDNTENWPANVRFQTGSDGLTGLTFEGETYESNVLCLRWDGDDLGSYWFAYPVELPKAGIYKLKFLACEWNNFNQDQMNGLHDRFYVWTNAIRVHLSKEVGPQSLQYQSFDEITDYEYANFVDWPVADQATYFTMNGGGGQGAELEIKEAYYTANEAGKHYLTFVGARAMYCAGGFEFTFEREISGVEEVEAANVANVKYYGIDGAEVVKPAKGALVIEKTTLDNGSVKVVKRVVR